MLLCLNNLRFFLVNTETKLKWFRLPNRHFPPCLLGKGAELVIFTGHSRSQNFSSSHVSARALQPPTV